MKTSRVDIILMRPSGGPRFKRLGLLIIVALLGFQFHAILVTRHLKLGYLSFTSQFSSACTRIRVPPALDYNGKVWESWMDLERLFLEFEPPMGLEQRNFPGGQTVKPTVKILHDFLNLTLADAKIMRQKHMGLVGVLPEYPDNVYKGRGVVMVAGGRYSEYAATTLGMLRRMGSLLPVEVWFKDSTEEEEDWCDELAADGISCRHLSDYLGEMLTFTHGYQYKTAAIFFSSFEEILFLDTDSIPVKNPDSIFDSLAYQDTGIVLWPDYWGSTESPWLPYITGQSTGQSTTVPNIITVDSGQMLWNKNRHWKTLCLSAYYNYFGPMYFYTLITQGGPGWGDKDTFPTALRALNLNFTLIPHRLQTQHYNLGNNKPTGSGMAMLQADPWDLNTFQPLFLHSNFIKLSVRRLMCRECTEYPSTLTSQERKEDQDVWFLGQMFDRDKPNSELLSHWKRIFATRNSDGSLNHLGQLDTERDIWKVLKKLACVGVWSEHNLCLRTRKYTRLTFGDGAETRNETAGKRCLVNEIHVA